MTVEEAARPDDGLLDVCSLGIRHRWHLLALFPALRSGRQGAWREVRSFASTGLQVRTRRPKRVDADGGIVTRTPGAVPR